jgi:hypothetical protein
MLKDFPPTKQCVRCEKEKPIEEFPLRSSGKTGQYKIPYSYCKPCDREYKRNNWKVYYGKKENVTRIRAYAKEYHKKWYPKVKQDVLDMFGGKCACCGETEPGFLSIDHVFNDGAEERRNGRGGGYVIGRRIINKALDKIRYQLLCYNCNMGKQFSGKGICPHQLKKEVVNG